MTAPIAPAGLFRIEDYPSKEAPQGRFGIRHRIVPVPDADHFMAKLASDDTERVKRDIEHQIEERLHDAVGDLYRRLGEAVERVSDRLQEDGEAKPLVFRDSMISNIRDLVDVVPRLNRKFAHLDRQAQKLGFQLLPKTQGEEKQNPMPSNAQASVTQEERDRSLRLSVGVKDLPDVSIPFRPVGVAAAVLPAVGDDHELKHSDLP